MNGRRPTPRSSLQFKDVYHLDAEHDVAICVDLGMSNTAVAVFAPGRTLPRESFSYIDVRERMIASTEAASDTSEDGDTGEAAVEAYAATDAATGEGGVVEIDAAAEEGDTIARAIATDELLQARLESERLRQEMETLRERVRTSERTREQLAEELAGARRRLSAPAPQLEQLNDEFSALQEMLDEERRRSEDLKRRLELAEERERSTTEEWEQRFQREVDRLEARETSLKRSSELLDERMDSLEERERSFMEHELSTMERMRDREEELEAERRELEGIRLALENQHNAGTMASPYEAVVLNPRLWEPHEPRPPQRLETALIRSEEFYKVPQLGAGDPPLFYEATLVRTILAEIAKPRSRLIILAGPPGTGKSSLVRAMCRLLNYDLDPSDEEDRAVLDAVFCLQPVSPAWLTPSNLLGWYSEIDGNFHKTPFWEFLARATKHAANVAPEQRRPFFACLDEFNLARPEHYLAELLAQMEAPGPDPRIPVASEKYGGAADVRLPQNVKLFATVNVDTSSHLLSPKVLDRALYLTVSPSWPALRQHLSDQLASIRGGDGGEATLGALDQLRDILLPIEEREGLVYNLYALAEAGQAPFGHRVLDMALEHAGRYVALYPPQGAEEELRDYAQGLVDDLLCGFFLPKLPSGDEVAATGYAEQLGTFGAKCEDWVGGGGRALSVLSQLRSQYRSGQMAWATRFGLPEAEE